MKFNLLGKANNKFPDYPSADTLEIFPNPNEISQNLKIQLTIHDFSSLCPITSQPDFAKIHITYTPNKSCIETKSLKFYLASYRNQKAFNEKIIVQICKHLTSACKPKKMLIIGNFSQRGGIALTAKAKYPIK